MALDVTKPSNDGLLINAPGEIRANWDAIVLGTDATLLITNAKCAAAMALVDSKLAQITTAAKVSGTALTLLPNIPAGAGVIPVANLPVGTTANKIVQLDAAAKIPALDGSQITNLVATNIATGTLPVGRGGTGATAAANAANGVVVLNGSSQLPAVSGALLTNLPSATTYAAGDYMVCKAIDEKKSSSESYVKLKEIKIGGSGTIRTIFKLKTTSPRDAWGKIYRNGGAVGTERTTASATYTTYTEDIAGWVTGDLLQLYVKTNYADSAISNLLGLGVATPDKESGVTVAYD